MHQNVVKFIMLLALFGICAVANAQEKPSAPDAGFTDRQIIESWGWIIAREKNLAGIEISEAEREVFLKGFSAGIKNQPVPCDSEEAFSDVEKLAKVRREKVTRAITQKNEAAAELFFAALKTNANVIKLPDGVCCEILKLGDGIFPKPQQTVTLHYTARLLDGTEFSQMGPIDLVLVTNRNVCRGWFEAIQKIGKGGLAKLFVPPPFSEDDAVKWGIQPGSAMIFEIELLDVKDTSAEDLENALIPPAPEPPAPGPSGCTDLQIMEIWGWSVARSTRAEKFGLSDGEIAFLSAGLAAGIASGPPPFDLKKIYPAVEKFVADRHEKVRLATRQKRLGEMKTLFTELKRDTNVVELSDGLRYEILKPGTGPNPKPGQIVLVDYTGRLIDGTVFDKTYNEPLHIEVGLVIPGWNEGIQKINKGGRIRLYIPPSLGYGDEDRSGVVAPIAADSTLIYEIELLDVQDTPDEK